VALVFDEIIRDTYKDYNKLEKNVFVNICANEILKKSKDKFGIICIINRLCDDSMSSDIAKKLGVSHMSMEKRIIPEEFRKLSVTGNISCTWIVQSSSIVFNFTRFKNAINKLLELKITYFNTENNKQIPKEGKLKKNNNKELVTVKTVIKQKK
jgi:hypothetical protein